MTILCQCPFGSGVDEKKPSGCSLNYYWRSQSLRCFAKLLGARKGFGKAEDNGIFPSIFEREFPFLLRANNPDGRTVHGGSPHLTEQKRRILCLAFNASSDHPWPPLPPACINRYRSKTSGERGRRGIFGPAASNHCELTDWLKAFIEFVSLFSNGAQL